MTSSSESLLVILGDSRTSASSNGPCGRCTWTPTKPHPQTSLRRLKLDLRLHFIRVSQVQIEQTLLAKYGSRPPATEKALVGPARQSPASCEPGSTNSFVLRFRQPTNRVVIRRVPHLCSAILPYQAEGKESSRENLLQKPRSAGRSLVFSSTSYVAHYFRLFSTLHRSLDARRRSLALIANGG